MVSTWILLRVCIVVTYPRFASTGHWSCHQDGQAHPAGQMKLLCILGGGKSPFSSSLIAVLSVSDMVDLTLKSMLSPICLLPSGLWNCARLKLPLLAIESRDLAGSIICYCCCSAISHYPWNHTHKCIEQLSLLILKEKTKKPLAHLHMALFWSFT